jgi:ribosomal protein S18 acetylase RimI-like enzyme
MSLSPSFFASIPPCPDFTFRLAQPADLNGWHHACYPTQLFATARERFAHILEMQAAGRCYLVLVEAARPGGPIVGGGRLVRFPNGAEIADLNIDPTYQGQGIGTALIEVLLTIARHLCLPAVEIGVASENGRALALYQRLGFAEDRRLRLPGAQEAIILRKTWEEAGEA